MQANSRRLEIFGNLLENSTAFLKHYVDLEAEYVDSDSLKVVHVQLLKDQVKTFASNKEKHYKYWIYQELNPGLTVSPFLNRIDRVGKCILKFRLGSHNLKIETGRWSRIKREARLCTSCNVLGDELHAIYACSEVSRSDLPELPPSLAEMWTYEGVNILFKRLMDAELVD